MITMIMMRRTLCATRLQVVRSIFSSLTRLEADQNDQNLFLPTRSRRILLPSSSGGSSTAASTRSGKVRGTSHRQDSGKTSHRQDSGKIYTDRIQVKFHTDRTQVKLHTDRTQVKFTQTGFR